MGGQMFAVNVTLGLGLVAVLVGIVVGLVTQHKGLSMLLLAVACVLLLLANMLL